MVDVNRVLRPPDIRKVGLIVIDGGRVLLCRKKKATARLILPGGKREPGETSLETLRRELAEELGKVELLNPEHLGVYTDEAVREGSGRTKIIEVELFAGHLEGEPRPCSEIGSLIWFGENDDWGALAPSLSRTIFPDLVKRGILGWRTPGLCGEEDSF